jgi:APA family basic amino acid/polyamine antiporter
MGMVEPSALAASTAPFADAASSLVGPWGAYVLAAGAAVSCLGALNGWILLSGQLPMAAARDGVLPAFLARRSRRGTPRGAIVISGAVASALIAANYTRGLVGAFTFMILLSTVATLVPYVFSSAAAVLVGRSRSGPLARAGAGTFVVASGAFLYSLWAIAGSGRDAVFWGFLLLIGGIPLYVGMLLKRPVGRGAPAGR